MFLLGIEPSQKTLRKSGVSVVRLSGCPPEIEKVVPVFSLVFIFLGKKKTGLHLAYPSACSVLTPVYGMFLFVFLMGLMPSADR